MMTSSSSTTGITPSVTNAPFEILVVGPVLGQFEILQDFLQQKRNEKAYELCLCIGPFFDNGTAPQLRGACHQEQILKNQTETLFLQNLYDPRKDVRNQFNDQHSVNIGVSSATGSTMIKQEESQADSLEPENNLNFAIPVVFFEKGRLPKGISWSDILKRYDISHSSEGLTQRRDPLTSDGLVRLNRHLYTCIDTAEGRARLQMLVREKFPLNIMYVLNSDGLRSKRNTKSSSKNDDLILISSKWGSVKCLSDEQRLLLPAQSGGKYSFEDANIAQLVKNIKPRFHFAASTDAIRSKKFTAHNTTTTFVSLGNIEMNSVDNNKSGNAEAPFFHSLTLPWSLEICSDNMSLQETINTLHNSSSDPLDNKKTRPYHEGVTPQSDPTSVAASKLPSLNPNAAENDKRQEPKKQKQALPNLENSSDGSHAAKTTILGGTSVNLRQRIETAQEDHTIGASNAPPLKRKMNIRSTSNSKIRRKELAGDQLRALTEPDASSKTDRLGVSSSSGRNKSISFRNDANDNVNDTDASSSILSRKKARSGPVNTSAGSNIKNSIETTSSSMSSRPKTFSDMVEIERGQFGDEIADCCWSHVHGDTNGPNSVSAPSEFDSKSNVKGIDTLKEIDSNIKSSGSSILVSTALQQKDQDDVPTCSSVESDVDSNASGSSTTSKEVVKNRRKRQPEESKSEGGMIVEGFPFCASDSVLDYTEKRDMYDEDTVLPHPSSHSPPFRPQLQDSDNDSSDESMADLDLEPLEAPTIDIEKYEEPKLPELVLANQSYKDIIHFVQGRNIVNPRPNHKNIIPIPENQFLWMNTYLPLHLAILNRTRGTPMSLFQAILSSYPNAARTLCENFTDDDKFGGKFALDYACEAHLKDDNEVKSVDIEENSIEDDLVRLLVKEWPPALLYKTGEGQLKATWLHRILEHRPNLKLVKYLVSKFNSLEIKYRRRPDCIQGPICEVKDGQGSLPLHTALEYNADASVVEYLIQEYPGALKHQRIIDENLPLHCAALYKCFPRVCTELLRRYPTALKVPNKEGKTPLHILFKVEEHSDDFRFRNLWNDNYSSNSKILSNQQDARTIDPRAGTLRRRDMLKSMIAHYCEYLEEKRGLDLTDIVSKIRKLVTRRDDIVKKSVYDLAFRCKKKIHDYGPKEAEWPIDDAWHYLDAIVKHKEILGYRKGN